MEHVCGPEPDPDSCHYCGQPVARWPDDPDVMQVSMGSTSGTTSCAAHRSCRDEGFRTE